MSRKLFGIAITILAACGTAAGADVLAPEGAPQPAALQDVTPGGELAIRLQKNFERLEEEKYQPHRVFLTNEESNFWPGDTEGRTILSLTLLAQALDAEPKYLDEILELTPEKMNHLGYFGDIQPPGRADEQQLSGHGWLLRGLCEHYLWQRDPRVLEMIKAIHDNLILPTAGLHARYPIDPSKREHGGSFIGTHRNVLDNWVLSSDIGCDFIFLDGVIQTYSILPSPELKAIIEEMVARYLEIDLAEIKAQTHATLTGLRGLLRWYEHTGDAQLIEAAQERFALYKREGMTETYENYNWFGRPTHTEPCAIVDSFMVAMKLWQFTGDTQYIEDAQHIYYNGIAGTQRANGGFGCNTCAGAEGPLLGIEMQEAHWCCTMRGSEGLSYVAQAGYFAQDDAIFVNMYADNSVKLAKPAVALQQRTQYPFRGHSTLRVTEAEHAEPVTLKFIAPSFAEGFEVTVNGAPAEVAREGGYVTLRTPLRQGDEIDVNFGLKTRWADPVNIHTVEGYRSLRYGPLVLAAVQEDADAEEVRLPESPEVQYVGRGQFEAGDVQLESAYHLMSEDFRAEDGILKQILFAHATK